MERRKTQSGFVKVERTQAERIRDYSLSNEIMQDIRDKIPSKSTADALIKSYTDAKGDRK